MNKPICQEDFNQNRVKPIITEKKKRRAVLLYLIFLLYNKTVQKKQGGFFHGRNIDNTQNAPKLPRIQA